MSESVKYYPEKDNWQEVPPQECGFDPEKLEDAVQYAVESEIKWPRDFRSYLGFDDPEPYNKILGPTKERGPAAGLVIKNGSIAARWGEIERVDMTFSATKSYISALIGIAIDRGLINGVHEKLSIYVKEGSFDSDHNRQISWHHLLQQTSEWQGELFGIPDTVDHNRSVQGSTMSSKKGEPRILNPPGQFWEYNDVRINMLAYAALHVFRQSLPELLKEIIMDPIGASSDWQWHPYENSAVVIDGKEIYSVPGGAHWGGGLWISSLDHARFGYLILRKGNWNGNQIIPSKWINLSLTPCELNPQYGYLWWLNTERKLFGSASKMAFAAMGAGGNIVFVDPQFDLVVVTRWAQDAVEIINRIVSSLESS